MSLDSIKTSLSHTFGLSRNDAPVRTQKAGGTANLSQASGFSDVKVARGTGANPPAASSSLKEKAANFASGVKLVFEEFKASPRAFVANLFSGLRSSAPAAPAQPVALATEARTDASNGELRTAFSMIQSEAPNYHPVGSTFMRGNTEDSKATSKSLLAFSQAHFGENTKTFMTSLRDAAQGPAFLFDNAFVGNTAASDDPQATVALGLKNFDDFMTLQFGSLGDAASIKDAADSMPQGFCDLLATAHRAIDALPGSQKSDADKADMKKAVTANFISLRCLSPTLTANAGDVPPGGQPLSADEKKNVIQVGKLVQNACNGIFEFKKDPLHPDAKAPVEQRMHAWNDQVMAFADRLIERGQAAAGTTANRMA